MRIPCVILWEINRSINIFLYVFLCQYMLIILVWVCIFLNNTTCVCTVNIYIYTYVWLVVSTPLKNMKVSWDDDSQLNGKIKHVPNHQPDMCGYHTYCLYVYMYINKKNIIIYIIYPFIYTMYNSMYNTIYHCIYHIPHIYIYIYVVYVSPLLQHPNPAIGGWTARPARVHSQSFSNSWSSALAASGPYV